MTPSNQAAKKVASRPAAIDVRKRILFGHSPTKLVGQTKTLFICLRNVPGQMPDRSQYEGPQWAVSVYAMPGTVYHQPQSVEIGRPGHQLGADDKCWGAVQP